MEFGNLEQEMEGHTDKKKDEWSDGEWIDGLKYDW